MKFFIWVVAVFLQPENGCSLNERNENGDLMLTSDEINSKLENFSTLECKESLNQNCIKNIESDDKNKSGSFNSLENYHEDINLDLIDEDNLILMSKKFYRLLVKDEKFKKAIENDKTHHKRSELFNYFYDSVKSKIYYKKTAIVEENKQESDIYSIMDSLQIPVITSSINLPSTNIYWLTIHCLNPQIFGMIFIAY